MKVDRLHLTLLLKRNWTEICNILKAPTEMVSDDLELILTLVYQLNESI